MGLAFLVVLPVTFSILIGKIGIKPTIKPIIYVKHMMDIQCLTQYLAQRKCLKK